MDWDRKLIKALLACGYPAAIGDTAAYSSGSAYPIKALSQKGLLNEIQAIRKLADLLRIPYYDLSDPGVCSRLSTKVYENKISSDFCWSHKIVPLFEENRSLIVACANPLEIDAFRQIQFATGMSVTPVIAAEDKICQLINKSFSSALAPHKTSQTEESEENVEIVTGAIEEEHDADKEEANSAPVAKLINRVLHDAVRLNASDIHFDPTPSGLDIRYRIDGVMHHALDCTKRMQRPLTCRLKLLAAMNIADHRTPQDGRFRVRVDDQPIDLRASCIPTAYGEKMVLRILQTNFDGLSLDRLGMPPEMREVFERDLMAPGKLILVTGPTGSGKTTTLYSCLKLLRDGTSNIVTVEDPIEFKISGINQMQINEPAGLTFASVLRSMLRQDPDIIMIGEIRDKETVDIALQAAQTGHLVLSTLHTNDAPSAISRMQSLECDQFLLASSVAGILAQRLIRRICRDCSEPFVPQTDALQKFCDRYQLIPSQLRRGRGCESCRLTGYRGRLGVYSYLHVTPEISDLIFHKASVKEIGMAAEQHGYIPLEKAALALVKQGLTAIDEIIQFFDQSTKESPSVSPLETQIVLLVEDDEINRATLAANFRARSYTVVEARDGAEAIERLNKSKPNVVVTGLGMPNIDGRQLLEYLRKGRETKEIPVLILTSADSDENEAELLRLGANDFVSRSRSPEVIIERLKRIS